jgi:hypothetical protein
MSNPKKSKLLSAGKTGLGLMAWGISVMAIFIPLLSEYGTWVALLLATVHGLSGGILLPILTMLTSLANLFLLSPLSSVGIVSGGITGVLSLAVAFSVKRALKSRLTGA